MQTDTTIESGISQNESQQAVGENPRVHRVEVLDLDEARAQSIPIVRLREVWKGIQYSALND